MKFKELLSIAFLALASSAQAVPIPRLQPLANTLRATTRTMTKNMARVPALGLRGLQSASNTAKIPAEKATKKASKINYRLLAGLGLSASVVATQHQPAEAIPMGFTGYEIINSKGHKIKLLLVNEAHLEDFHEIYTYITKLVEAHHAQLRKILADCEASSIPVEILVEAREEEINDILQRPNTDNTIMTTVLHALKNNTLQLPSIKTNNITFKFFDLRSTAFVNQWLRIFNYSPEDLKEYSQGFKMADGISFEDFLEQHLPQSFKNANERILSRIEAAKLSTETKDLVRQTMEKAIEQIHNMPNDFDKMFQLSWVDTDTALLCDIYSSIEHATENKILLVQGGGGHISKGVESLQLKGITPLISNGIQSQNDTLDVALFFNAMVADAKRLKSNPDQKAAEFEAVKQQLGEDVLKSQGIQSYDDLITAGITRGINATVGEDFYTPIAEFLKK